jgi:two-component system sensor histidine kinase KdpD
MRRALAYVEAVGGVAAITALIAGVRPWLDLPNLAVAYLLLVLWLGARHGWLPALLAAVLAFLAFDWFFVPPYGTLWISAPRELLNLVALLVAALAGVRLVASLSAREAGAVAEAQESGIVNELAITALREPVEPALEMLCERAVALGGLASMSLLAPGPTGLELIAGAPVTELELAEAGPAHKTQTSVGARIREGRLELERASDAGPAYVVLSGGLAVLRPARPPLTVPGRRLLAALLGLAGLLLDRHRADVVSDQARAWEASDRLKAAVLSSISHELKSPIASLRAGLTTLLMPRAGLDDEKRDLVAGLDRQATRLDRLVGDLLTMSRLEAGLPLARAPQDLEELVGQVLHAVQQTLAGFRVEVRLDSGLPPVDADEILIERVLTNLVENAAEWSPAGARIEVGARTAGPCVEIWVDNEGPAIAEAELEQIFDKFWTRRRGGSGLGLAICRRIVEAHGGSIRAENRAAGPRFVFQLPAARVTGSRPG